MACGAALGALAPGGVCTGTGHYLGTSTALPVMDMYATSAVLHIGVSHVRLVLPDFVARTGFAAEHGDHDAVRMGRGPQAHLARTTKLVLHRPQFALT